MNIIIVEDTKTVRYRLVSLLDGQHDYKVVADMESAEEALEYLAGNFVDLVILDLGLPGLSDDRAVKAIKTASPELNILVLTATADDDKVFSVLKAGATGYLLKDAQPMEIIAAIEEIKAGGSPMSPSIARKVLREFQRLPAHEELKGIISPRRAGKRKSSRNCTGGTTSRRSPITSASALTLFTPISRTSMRSSRSTPVRKPSMKPCNKNSSMVDRPHSPAQSIPCHTRLIQ